MPRIRVKQTLLVSQNHQVFGFNQIRNQRTQCVVVAELDFLGDHGVILVDHRDDTQLQHRAQGATRIQVAGTIIEVGLSK